MNWIKRILVALANFWPPCLWAAIKNWQRGFEEQRKRLEDSDAALRIADSHIRLLSEEYKMLRSQVMQLRVAQAPHPRTGWEIMAYIPNEVVDKLKRDKAEGGLREYFVSRIASGLVDFAVRGIVHVAQQGRVNALVFEPLDIREAPRAPKWMQVLYERENGELHLSGKAKLIDPGSPEERARRASGL
jgi:uncharacterized protein with ATP-grasp and redox domains